MVHRFASIEGFVNNKGFFIIIFLTFTSGFYAVPNFLL